MTHLRVWTVGCGSLMVVLLGAGCVHAQTQVEDAGSSRDQRALYLGEGRCLPSSFTEAYLDALDTPGHGEDDLYCMGLFYYYSQTPVTVSDREGLDRIAVGFWDETCEIGPESDACLYAKLQKALDLRYTQQRYHEAIRILHDLAMKGNAAAQYHLALAMMPTSDDLRDRVIKYNEIDHEIGRWLYRAAQQGYFRAQGFMSHEPTLDPEQRLKWAILAMRSLNLLRERQSEIRTGLGIDDRADDSSTPFLGRIDLTLRQEYFEEALRIQEDLADHLEDVNRKLETEWMHEGALQLRTSGTAFYVNENGDILTSAHVVAPGGRTCDLTSVASPPDGLPRFVTRSADEIVTIDHRSDLALLPGSRVNSWLNLRGPDFGVARGEAVIVTGFPMNTYLAYEMHVTTGIVAATSGPLSDTRLVEITAPLRMGNSGGPVLDSNGEVIGVAVQRGQYISGEPQLTRYAVSLETVRRFLGEHRARYSDAGELNRLSVPQIAAQAENATVLIECWMVSR